MLTCFFLLLPLIHIFHVHIFVLYFVLMSAAFFFLRSKCISLVNQGFVLPNIILCFVGNAQILTEPDVWCHYVSTFIQDVTWCGESKHPFSDSMVSSFQDLIVTVVDLLDFCLYTGTSSTVTWSDVPRAARAKAHMEDWLVFLMSLCATWNWFSSFVHVCKCDLNAGAHVNPALGTHGTARQLFEQSLWS